MDYGVTITRGAAPWQIDHADERERDLRLGDVAQSHLRGGVRRGDAGVLQADERDEQADARGDAVFQVLGDAVDQRLTELERGKNDEDNAFH